MNRHYNYHLLLEICPGIFGFEIRDTGFPGMRWSGKRGNPGIWQEIPGYPGMNYSQVSLGENEVGSTNYSYDNSIKQLAPDAWTMEMCL
jgi:hypothetical protein